MVDVETVIQAISQTAVEALKVTIVAVNEEKRRHGMGAGNQNTTEIISLQTGGPSLKQIIFHRSTRDTYVELKTLKWSIFLRRHYEISDTERHSNNKRLAR